MINLANELQNKEYYSTIIKRYLDKELHLPADFNIDNYIEMILNNYTWSMPTQYLIPKDNGKFREIYSFTERDSFLLKVINEILFKKCGHLISESVYSYTKGIRTYNACRHIQHAIRTSSNLIGYKLDLSNYFLSVDKKIILNAVNELVEDELGKTILNNFFSIRSYIHKGEIYSKELSLMPGSAISAFFANYIPHDIDNFIEDNADLYARYGDDMVIFTRDEDKLNKIYAEVSKMYGEIGLKFNESKTEILNSNKPITFLGLTTTRSSIDISSKNFMKMKKFVKHMVKIKVKKGDLNSVKSCINLVNRILLGQDESTTELVPHSKLAYIYSNVTTDRTLKELDFYFKDRIRQAFTGKNNTGNIKKLPNDQLVELGYTSFAQLYYLSRVGKQFLYNEVSIRNHNNNFKASYMPILSIKDCTLTENKLIVSSDFEDFLMYLARNMYPLVINDEVVYVEYLDFNLDEKCIKWKDTIIAQGNMCTTNIQFIDITNNTINTALTDKLLVHDKKLNHLSINLMTLFIRSCYYDIYPMKDSRIKKNYKTKTYTRMYKFIDLIQVVNPNSIAFNVPYYARKFRFNLYLYSHIVGKDIWEDIDYSKGSLIDVNFQCFSLVLKKSWFE